MDKNPNILKVKRGGARPGAGRKRLRSKGIAHREREGVSSRVPLHINFKYRVRIRYKVCLRLLKRAIENARGHGLRVRHFSLQHNHVHLIVEADNNLILETGMRSLTVTFAKGLKMGKVQLDRYHLHVLKNLRETRNAIMYVLFNKQRHEKRKSSVIDEFCSLMNWGKAEEVIKIFVKRKRVTLKIGERAWWVMDPARSWILKNAEITLKKN